MMLRWTIMGLVLIILTVGVQGKTHQAVADDKSSAWVSKVISLQGRVVVKRLNETSWHPVKLNDTLFAGDRILVEARSRAGIVLRNDAVLRLDQNTTLVFTRIEKETTFIFKLLKGAVNFFSRRARSLKILTPFVNGVVEGTEFYVQVDEHQTRIDLFEGRIRAENEYGELQLTNGQGALATADSAPQRRILVRPRDSVQWALYYPPVLALGSRDVPDPVRNSIAAFNQGRTLDAVEALDTVEEAGRNAIFYAYRAAVLLHLGRVAQAGQDLRQALAEDPDNGEALGLKAVIAVTQNQKEAALQTAQEAVRRAPSSAAAHIALSYAHQAHFDLAQALKAARTAVTLAPENGTAWARLSELLISTGELDKGIHAGRKAVKLDPNAAHAHTTLGFAYLTQIKIHMARTAFEKSISLDSAAPLPRLGLGLAEIRDGNLAGGRREIEIAAGLDPVNALIRSYLGKAYFDEKRGPLDGKQLEIAKALDPNDPTPWFYDAIRKQTLNRPVEALHDLNKTIELNDNRAVYRSRLMLDDDLGSRSVSLGRIYNELGFQQLALVEGWKSVNTDPSNHSAHRFLSDTYAALPRHEVARVSELLQSQLLQPINLTPVQPQLSRSNFFMLEGSGTAKASLNEYNPLFHRNRNSLLASGVIGEKGILGDEIVFSGLWKNVSYGIGQYHYETDGFRKNNDFNRDAYNVFLQTSLSNKISIMAEGRRTEREEGDLPLRFAFDGKDVFSPNLREERDENSFRIGLRITTSPRSQIISQATYVTDEETVDDLFGSRPFQGLVDDSGYMVEAQHLYNATHFDLTGGLGYFDRDRDQTINLFGSTTSEFGVDHTNCYLYSYVSYPENVTWTIGGSYDHYDDDQTNDREQFNPKFGITVTPLSGTTLRAAAFSTVKRSLAGRQTIEPTQVAGFNQFFDDKNGAKSRRYGIAIDQTFSPRIHGGIEYSTREITSSFVDLDLRKRVDGDWDERLTRAYLYWTPNALFALSAEYLFEEFEREDGHTGEERINDLDTHRVPLGLSFFHPCGFSANIKGTFIKQKGIFGTRPRDYRPGEDSFWLFDAGLRYRLPGRLGFISAGVRNLFDTDINFQDMDLANQTIFPERTIYGKVTFSF